MSVTKTQALTSSLQRVANPTEGDFYIRVPTRPHPQATQI